MSTNPNIIIHVASVSNGPYTTYVIHILSSASIDVVEAFVESQSLTPTYENDTNGYWYNLTLSQTAYSPGTYPVKIVVFTTTGESNYVTEQFKVTSEFGQASWIVKTFGSAGIFIATIVSVIGVLGLLIEADVWHKKRNTEYVNLNGQVLLQGKKIRRWGRKKNVRRGPEGPNGPNNGGLI